MRTITVLALAAALVVAAGCDDAGYGTAIPIPTGGPLEPPATVLSEGLALHAVGFRKGMANNIAMKVDNLSSTQGIEAWVHVFNGDSVRDSRRFVIHAEKQKDVGLLEMGWKFGIGDLGVVTVEGHPVRAYFKLIDADRYAVRYLMNALDDEGIRKLDFKPGERAM